MATGIPSDEVAEDYKNSLEDLTLNSRYEISNLTVIAKENMDYALAISRVLENHIRTVRTTIFIFACFNPIDRALLLSLYKITAILSLAPFHSRSWIPSTRSC